MCVRLTTDRLTLRALREDDAPRLAQLANDAEIARMTTMIPHPYPVEVAEGWILIQRARIAARSEFNLVIDATGEGLVGKVGLFRRKPTAEWEIGYWIGRPFWGRGYASEAVACVVKFAREQLGANTLTAGYFEDNDASRRVLERNGFVPTGAKKQSFSLARGQRAMVVGMAHTISTPANPTHARLAAAS